MEILSLHIEYLLLHHDCVVLPGIGAFINVRHSASFDIERGIITAPVKEVIFNQSLKSDDGLLAKSYARKYQISYREGSELMLRSIAALGEVLATDHEATIGKLGILCREKEGNLRFHPYKSARNLAYQLGRVEVPVGNVTTSEDNAESADTTVASELNEPIFEIEETNTEVEEPIINQKSRELDFEKNYYIPVNKTFIKISACLLVCFMISLAFIYRPSSNNTVEERASVLPIDKVIDTALQTSQNLELKHDSLHALQPQDSLKELQEQGDNYYLIVATCTSPEEAEKFIKKNSSAGYELSIISSTKYWRVSASSDSDRQQLIETMHSNEFKEHFPKAWIWKKE
ncbi:MAG: hypothetical protein K2L89_06780 [Muribaculaceae bacterium]|nr:hypothetical protein [Muribaculaceae bacterium]